MSEQANEITLQPQWATVKKTAELYQHAITESGLRWWIFNAEHNQFNRCLRRVGRKILINLDALSEWINQQDGHNGI